MLYEDETTIWRFALPRVGWWHSKAQRFRLPTRPLSPSHIKREEHLKRQAWGRYHSWSRVTNGVLLNVMGAVQYGTSKVFYKVVPQFDAEGFRQYIHQGMATFSKTKKEVIMVADRSGIHRAHKLASTLTHWHEQFRLYLLPARCGHHLNPIEFLFRDAKQFTGLMDCQARAQAKLAFHFNASLTAVTFAKLEAHQQQGHTELSFSMASLKRRAFNQHLLDCICEHLANGQSLEKFSPMYDMLCNYGIITQFVA